MNKGSRRQRASRKGLAIGLTGGIACGKTEAARLFERLGAVVADADVYAREALRPGSLAYRKTVRLFGRDILQPDGEINRRHVAKMVARHAGMRAKLERIVHPVVIRRLRNWVKSVTRKGRHAVAVVPLLYEVGMTDLWDAVVCVAASRRVILERLAARGMSRAEAAAWIRAQMPVRTKASRSDYVIWNDGSRSELKRQVQRVWEEIVKRGAGES